MRIIMAILLALVFVGSSFAQSVDVVIGEDVLEVECVVLTTPVKIDGEEIAPLWLALAGLIQERDEDFGLELTADLLGAWTTCGDELLTVRDEVWGDPDGEELLVDMIVSSDPSCYDSIRYGRGYVTPSISEQMWWRSIFVDNCI